MVNKLPNTAVKKWKRYSNIEKWFIGYIFILIASIIALPIINIYSSTWNLNNQFYIIDILSITSLFFLIFILLFLLAWNISFRFKKLIHLLFWFKENEAIVNFWILILITILYIGIWDTISLLKDTYDYNLWIWIWYYITWFILIVWLIRNIILALDLSKDKKKNRIINIIQKENTKQETEWLKSLFDKK